ncbi:hypothetical protein B0H10DRAFT_288267 [Mycena sp. CBHHK59/15]|nr:hypothetical protein B0H10DRAFT_288267 [Mycena sp. CBHHK59/15]
MNYRMVVVVEGGVGEGGVEVEGSMMIAEAGADPRVDPPHVVVPAPDLGALPLRLQDDDIVLRPVEDHPLATFTALALPLQPEGEIPVVLPLALPLALLLRAGAGLAPLPSRLLLATKGVDIVEETAAVLPRAAAAYPPGAPNRHEVARAHPHPVDIPGDVARAPLGGEVPAHHDAVKGAHRCLDPVPRLRDDGAQALPVGDRVKCGLAKS